MDKFATVFYTLCPLRQKTVGEIATKNKGAREKGYTEKQHEIAEDMLSMGLQKLFHLDLKKLNIKKGIHGKPFIERNGQMPSVDDCYFNISHCNGMVVCAVSNTEVGVDVERIRPIRESIVSKCCNGQEQDYILNHRIPTTPFGAMSLPEGKGQGYILNQGIHRTNEKKSLNRGKEESFFRIWTLKESYIKMIGSGMGFPLCEVNFTLEEGNIKCNQAGYFVQSNLKDDYILSICTKENAAISQYDVLKLP
ncbi:4'-phosphopantetheinyl transferase superfamily protein [Lachnospiraceae bacterium ZAX-1]